MSKTEDEFHEINDEKYIGKIIGNNNKYKLVEIIGSGALSTVWKAEVVKTNDLQNNTVAIKIQHSGDDNDEYALDEIEILRITNKSSSPIIKMLDNFEANFAKEYIKKTIKSKNGKKKDIIGTKDIAHICIVLELMSSNLYELQKSVFIDAYDEFKKNEFVDKKKYWQNKRLSINNTKIIAKQLLEALDFLHKNRIVHTDLKPENIMFTDNENNNEIRLVDFGGAHWDYKKSEDHLFTEEYRAPECILGHKYSNKIDIWAAGCIIFEMLTGTPLFSISSNPRIHKFNKFDTDDDYDWEISEENEENNEYSTESESEDSYSESDSEEEDNDDLPTFVQLYKICAILGKIPSDIKSKLYIKLSKFGDYFNRHGELRYINDKFIAHRSICEILRDDFRYSEEDSREINDFLVLFLDWNPENRKNAAELLNHDWFANIIEEKVEEKVEEIVEEIVEEK